MFLWTIVFICNWISCFINLISLKYASTVINGNESQVKQVDSNNITEKGTINFE